MADEQEDVLELTEPLEPDHEEGEPSDDIEIEVEGEEAEEETPNQRRMREHIVALTKDNAELRRKTKQDAAPPDPGPKPTLWEDAEGDEDKYDALKAAWDARVRAVEAFEKSKQQAAETRNHTFERSIAAYREQAAKLGVTGFADAEAKVKEALPEVVQSAIPVYFKEPAKLVAALGRSPRVLAEIAAEPDQMRQIMMLKDIEGKIKVVNKRRLPDPEAETIQRGSAPLSGSGMTQAKFTKRLNELEDEADRNGGKRNKIREFKAQWKGKFA